MATYEYKYKIYKHSEKATKISKRISRSSARFWYGIIGFIFMLIIGLVTHTREYITIGLVFLGIEFLLMMINNRMFGERRIIKALAKDNPELFSEKELQMIGSGDGSRIDSVISNFKQATGFTKL